MTIIFKCECPRCAGKGEIKAFSNVMGGVCFDCNGKGFILRKTPLVKNVKFAMMIDGQRICARMARNAEAARKAFAAQLAGSKLAGKPFEVIEVVA